MKSIEEMMLDDDADEDDFCFTSSSASNALDRLEKAEAAEAEAAPAKPRRRLARRKKDVAIPKDDDNDDDEGAAAAADSQNDEIEAKDFHEKDATDTFVEDMLNNKDCADDDEANDPLLFGRIDGPTVVSNGASDPPPPASKKRKRAPAKKRAAADGEAPARRKPAKKPRNQSEKMEKLRQKHKRKTQRNAAQVLGSAVENFVGVELHDVQSEVGKSQIECVQVLRNMEGLLSEATLANGAMRTHAALLEKLRKDKQPIPSQVAAMKAAADVIEKQHETLSQLTTRVSAMTHAVGELAAKCEAASRHSVNNSLAANRRDRVGMLTQSSALPLVASDRATIQQKWLDCGGQVDQIDEVEHPRTALAVAANGGGALGLSTRAAPQIIRGAPGTHFVSFSLTRSRVDARNRVQTQVSRRHRAAMRLTAPKRANNQALHNLVVSNMPLLITNGSAETLQIADGPKKMALKERGEE